MVEKRAASKKKVEIDDETFDILQLPILTVKHILEYVPKRAQAALVCKTFHDLIVEIEQFKFKVRNL